MNDSLTIEAKYDLSDRDLECWLIFCVCVANKSEQHGLRIMSGLVGRVVRPFRSIRRMVRELRLDKRLRKLRSGQYTRIRRALGGAAFSGLNLRTCSVQDLEAIHGIGPKTARYFMLRTRPRVRVAALDTHVLKWLRALGYPAPKGTPSGRRYAELEAAFLREADAREMSPSELDSAVWCRYAKMTEGPPGLMERKAGR